MIATMVSYLDTLVIILTRNINQVFHRRNRRIRHIRKILRIQLTYCICVSILTLPVPVSVLAANPIPRSLTTRVINSAYPQSAVGLNVLPTPYGGSYTVGGVANPNWLVSGQVTAVESSTATNTALNLNQTSNEALMDWASFDIGQNTTVNFNQPASTSKAINRIHQQSPAQIYGNLNSNGQVFLINQNGFIFGKTGHVDTNSFLASTLKITEQAIQNGITSTMELAFEAFTDSDTGANLSGDIFIEEGFSADIRGRENGRFLALARNVTNNGAIKTPDGQIILAAGNKVYLTTDQSLPGWLVQVDSSNLPVASNGTVTNDLAGGLIAERGNVSVVARTINQNGLVSATTAVQKGGSIILRAQTDSKSFDSGETYTPTTAGDVIFGEGSVTKITPDTSTETVADVTAQPKSTITVKGQLIHLKKNSKIIATSGNVDITAREKLSTNAPLALNMAGEGRIYVEGSIDVSGATVSTYVDVETGEVLPISASNNLITVDLRADEFKDSPVQRNGVLRGENITFDIRKTGKNADGSIWEGTAVADVSGSIDGIRRTASERSLTGGTIALSAAKDVIITPEATLNISGGAINYQDGNIDTTKIISEGRILDISEVTAQQRISSISEGLTRRLARVESAYVEGKDAGTLSIDSSGLVLAGTIIGNARVGRYQRNTSTSSSNTNQEIQRFTNNRLYRPTNEVPLTGQIILGNQLEQPVTGRGNDYRLHNVTFMRSAYPHIPGVNDSLGSEFNDIILSPDLLLGIGRINVRANGRISVAEAITLPGQAEFSLLASQIKILDEIKSPEGKVTLTATNTGAAISKSDFTIELGSKAKIDVSGNWVNDSLFISRGRPQGPLHTNGGSVELIATSSVQESRLAQIKFNSGSKIDVSAGAKVNASGKISAGKAGYISLKSSLANGLAIDPALASLAGYAVNEGKGGKLTISTGEQNINICNSGCLLNPLAFNSNGFSDFTLEASAATGEVNIRQDTEVNLKPLTQITRSNANRQRTGSDIHGFSSLGRMPENYNRKVSLSASAYRINVEMNSAINLLADPLSKLTFDARRLVYIDGSIAVPAGTIDIKQGLGGFDGNDWRNQYIWLGDNAHLSARGAFRRTPANFGLFFGEIFDAGNIELNSLSGYVIAQSGASLDVSATTASLDIKTTGGRSQFLRNVRVGGSAGDITLKAGEGIFYQGALIAQAANVPGASGGKLSVQLIPNNNRSEDSIADKDFGNEQRSRSIIVTDYAMTSAVENYRAGSGGALQALTSVGDLVDNKLNGLAIVTKGMVESSGISSLELNTSDFFNENSVRSNGQIVLQGNVNLKLGQQITLNAPVILSDGGNAVVSAPYLLIGSNDKKEDTLTGRLTKYLDDSVFSGSGITHFNADFIEVLGRLGLSNQSETHFNSRGDIRFRGISPQGDGNKLIIGSLISKGDVYFDAAQLYASTLSDFTINAVETINEVDGSLDVASVIPSIFINSNGNQATPVLSAASRISFSANKITQNGVVKAPLGEINFTGRQVTLNKNDVLNKSVIKSTLVVTGNSVTSTSTEGQIIPFGKLLAGSNWAYELKSGLSNVLSDDFSYIPKQGLNIKGDNIDTQKGAVWDIRGGGDLLAYEFVSGVEGTKDFLSTADFPNTFAIIPRLNKFVAPFDPQETAGIDLPLGSSVYLDSPASGLAAGNYTLLPARYALLPGAYLIESVSGFQDINSGAIINQTDGSKIISGRFTNNGSGNFDNRTSGFRLLKNTDLGNFAHYDTSLGGDFFTAKGYTGPTSLDDGRISISATSSLKLNAKLLAQSGVNGGRGSQVDIASNNLALVTQAGQGRFGNDVIELSVAQLTALGADSLLLGGRRQHNGDTTVLDITANKITVDDGVEFSSKELLLAAKDNLTVRGSAILQAKQTADIQQRTGDETLQLQQDAALIHLSSFNSARLQRSSEANQDSNLNVEDGATLNAVRAGLFSAANNFNLSGTNLDFKTASLTLAANQINLGTNSKNTSGLNLTASDLNNLKADKLILDSANTIDFYSNMDIATNNLSLRAAAYNAMTAGLQVNFNIAETTRLENPAGSTTAKIATGTGTLSFNSNKIALGATAAGKLGVNGFTELNLTAQNQLLIDGNGQLNTAANITLATPLLTAATGRNYKVGDADNRTGNINIISTGTLAENLAENRGARLELVTNGTLNIDSNINMHSGDLIANALGDVTLGSNANVDLSGEDIDFADTLKGSSGGYFSATSDGNIELAANAVVNVSAGSHSGNAGVIDLSASNGTINVDASLLANHAVANKGGEFIFDANALTRSTATTVSAFTDLNQALALNGFNRTREFRLRSGDINVDNGLTIVANTIKLTADQGGISVGKNAVLDARGEQAGNIMLAAKNDITVLNNSAMYANATGANQHGGRIFIGSSKGNLQLSDGTVLDVSGTDNNRDGIITLRTARNAENDSINNITDTHINSTFVGAYRVNMEVVKNYDIKTINTIDPTDLTATKLNIIKADTASFMANASTIKTLLGRTESNFHITPGIDISSDSDITLASNLDLSTWRAGGEPGTLTLRAKNNININANISDGFSGSTSSTLLSSDSWNYRLVAGADLSSVNPLAIADRNSFTTNKTANLIVGTESVGRFIRTGTGDIELASAQDIRLSNTKSVIYTAGRVNPGINYDEQVPENKPTGGCDPFFGCPPGPPPTPKFLPYASQGGNISLTAGNEIIGIKSQQLVSEWLWRVSNTDSVAGNNTKTAWTVQHANFQQNIGVLGGGNANVYAKGNITDLFVMNPSTGSRVIDSNNVNNLLIQGGGNSNLEAVGDITGGRYLVDRGVVTLESRGEIGNAGNDITDSPLFLIGNGSVNATARNDINIGGIGQWSLLLRSTDQDDILGAARVSDVDGIPIGQFFFLYDDNNSVNLTSIAGDSVLRPSASIVSDNITAANDGYIFKMLPPGLSITSFSGNISINNEIAIVPSRTTNIELLADKNITLGKITLLDSDQASLPGPLKQLNRLTKKGETKINGNSLAQYFYSSDGDNSLVHSARPATSDANQFDGILNDSPALVVARTGDIEFNGVLDISKPLTMKAGRDIINPSIRIQNLRNTDVSTIQAGRDVIYPIQFDPANGLITSSGDQSITVAGPGQLYVMAGRDINLGASIGISSIGNLDNSAGLPNGGANITLLTGVAERPDFSQFVSTVIREHNENATSLYQFIGKLGQNLQANISTQINTALSRADILLLPEQQRLAAVMAEILLQPEQLNDVYQSLDNKQLAFLYQAGQLQNTSGNFKPAVIDSSLAVFNALRPVDQQAFAYAVYYDELRATGRAAIETDSDDYSRGDAAADLLFEQANVGDLNMIFSQVRTRNGGDINILAPNGRVDVGLSAAPKDFGLSATKNIGLVVEGEGNINSFSRGDFLVNESKVFTAESGNILIWSSYGNIDAGRGAKTAISSPKPEVIFDDKGNVVVTVPPILNGSGIRSSKAGDIDLIAPRGVVNAADAGIGSNGGIYIPGPLIGEGNIDVGGFAGFKQPGNPVAVNLDVGGDVTSSVTKSVTDGISSGLGDEDSLGSNSLALLFIEILGFSDEKQCTPGVDGCK